MARTVSINPNKKAVIIAEAKSFVCIVFIALLIRTLIIEPFYIPSTSMKDTLLVGDYLFSTKYSYGYSRYSMLFINPKFWHGRILAQEPERGDIVIFRPPHKMDMRFIKRLIGMPGDKIQLINSVVYINDKPLKRDYIGELIESDGEVYKKYIETLPNGVRYHVLQLANTKPIIMHGRYNNTQVFYVPEGKYFFMGDNRDQSGDSRAELGFVPFENFIAKAQFIWFSTAKSLWMNSGGIVDQIAQIYHWITSIRFERLLHSVYGVS